MSINNICLYEIIQKPHNLKTILSRVMLLLNSFKNAVISLTRFIYEKTRPPTALYFLKCFALHLSSGGLRGELKKTSRSCYFFCINQNYNT